MRTLSNKPKLNSTQSFDSQSSLGGETEKMDDTVPFVDTVPYDDTVTVEQTHEMETQRLNLEGETQVLDSPDYMETQLIDDFDTQVVVDTDDDEGTDTTEVFDGDDEFLEDESFRKLSGQFVGGQGVGCTSLSKEAEKENLKLFDDSSEKQPCTGSVQRNFASIRAASLRASGLAARNKGMSSGSYSALSNNHSSEERSVELHGTSFGTEDVDEEHVTGISGERLRTSTIRRLFSDDIPVEKEELFKLNQSDRGDLLQFAANDGEVAGLSYIGSQEPGDLSQANALEFVDKFLQENVDTDQEFQLRKSAKGKSKTISTAKGPQCLAKANSKISVRKAGVFDWDDNREDECGGDILRRKKEEFFGSDKHCRRTLTEPQKPRGRRIYGSGDKDARLDLHHKVLRDFQSDSKLAVHNVKEPTSDKVTRMNFRKNLIDELNGDCDVNHLDGQKETIVADDPPVMDVGFDTQLAAEAMEALGNGDDLTTSDNIVHDGIQNKYERCQEDLNTRRTRNRVYSKPPSLQKRNSSNLTLFSTQSKSSKKFASSVVDQSVASSGGKSKNVNDTNHSKPTSTRSEKKQGLKAAVTSTPVAHRTRQSSSARRLQVLELASNGYAKGSSSDSLKGKRGSGTALASEMPSSGGRTSELVLDQSRGYVAKRNKREKLDVAAKSAVTSRPSVPGFDTLSHPKRRRSCKLSSGQISDKNDLDGSLKSCVGLDCNEQTVVEHKNLLDNVESTRIRSGSKRRRYSSCSSPAIPSTDKCFDRQQSLRRAGKSDLQDIACNSSDNGGILSPNANESHASGIIVQNKDNDALPPRLDKSQKVMGRPVGKACTTPSNPTSPVIKGSPVCMGDEYLKQSCKKNFSRSCLLKELRDLTDTRTKIDLPLQNSRKRRDIGNVRVLYSQHLDEDVVKQQKKKLDRLGVVLASSIADATHFITDKFVRTKNMLEAVASGKPVVTHLWIDSCAQAACFIDEKMYILRDTKKEQELGFNMLVSLECARQRPLLQGRRVLITPNTKPSKEIISSLVKAVHGQALEKVGRSAMKADKIPDDILILSCEEDYGMCVPFLKKGAAIFSSELLLNGIVVQKLEYERHRLFADLVKKTRSTIWLRKDGKNFEPVAKNK